MKKKNPIYNTLDLFMSVRYSPSILRGGMFINEDYEITQGTFFEFESIWRTVPNDFDDLIGFRICRTTRGEK